GRNAWSGQKQPNGELTLDMGDSIKGKGMIEFPKLMLTVIVFSVAKSASDSLFLCLKEMLFRSEVRFFKQFETAFDGPVAVHTTKQGGSEGSKRAFVRLRVREYRDKFRRLGVGPVQAENVAADEKESIPSETEFCIEAGSVGR
ncbi:hypothetical protein Tco_0919025, partial [Tanacetum coccineum]